MIIVERYLENEMCRQKANREVNYGIAQKRSELFNEAAIADEQNQVTRKIN